DLRASSAVHIESGGRVVGDSSAPRIGIANGALIRGTVHTEGEQALPAARRPRPPAAMTAPAPRPAPPPLKAPPPPPPPPPPEPKPAVRPALAVVEPHGEPAAVKRRPPPPVVPALGKGAKAKKKQGRES